MASLIKQMERTMNNQINSGVNALANQEGWAYTAGFLQSQLLQAIALLPKTKQKVMIADFERAVGMKVKVKVTNLLSGKEVELAWDEVGGPCDPSTERYHCM